LRDGNKCLNFTDFDAFASAGFGIIAKWKSETITPWHV